MHELRKHQRLQLNKIRVESPLARSGWPVQRRRRANVTAEVLEIQHRGDGVVVAPGDGEEAVEDAVDEIAPEPTVTTSRLPSGEIRGSFSDENGKPSGTTGWIFPSRSTKTRDWVSPGRRGR